MRIKLFENFQSDKIKEDIEDIFVELQDIGYKVEVKVGSGIKWSTCEIKLSKENGSDINFDEIREFCMMFEDYISDKSPVGLKYHNRYRQDSHFPVYNPSLIKYIKIQVYISDED